MQMYLKPTKRVQSDSIALRSTTITQTYTAPKDKTGLESSTYQSKYVDRKILNRWEKWKPKVLLYFLAVKSGVQDKQDESLDGKLFNLDWVQHEHETQIRRLLSAGVDWRTIKRNNLDDPLLDPDYREEMTEEFILRQYDRNKRRQNAAKEEE